MERDFAILIFFVSEFVLGEKTEGLGICMQICSPLEAAEDSQICKSITLIENFLRGENRDELKFTEVEKEFMTQLNSACTAEKESVPELPSALEAILSGIKFFEKSQRREELKKRIIVGSTLLLVGKVLNNRSDEVCEFAKKFLSVPKLSPELESRFGEAVTNQAICPAVLMMANILNEYDFDSDNSAEEEFGQVLNLIEEGIPILTSSSVDVEVGDTLIQQAMKTSLHDSSSVEALKESLAEMLRKMDPDELLRISRLKEVENAISSFPGSVFSSSGPECEDRYELSMCLSKLHEFSNFLNHLPDDVFKYKPAIIHFGNMLDELYKEKHNSKRFARILNYLVPPGPDYYHSSLGEAKWHFATGAFVLYSELFSVHNSPNENCEFASESFNFQWKHLNDLPKNDLQQSHHLEKDQNSFWKLYIVPIEEESKRHEPAFEKICPAVYMVLGAMIQGILKMAVYMVLGAMKQGILKMGENADSGVLDLHKSLMNFVSAFISVSEKNENSLLGETANAQLVALAMITPKRSSFHLERIKDKLDEFTEKINGKNN